MPISPPAGCGSASHWRATPRSRLRGYTHYAFAVEPAAFARQAAELRAHGVVEWQPNRSEGESLYVLDPDGHQLELHVGDLASRLAYCRRHPYPGMRIFD